MPFFPSMEDTAGPRSVFTAHPEIYKAWSEMSEALMNGSSPLSQADRELILAWAAAVADCAFVYIAHSEVAYARGVPDGLIAAMLADFDSAPIEPKLRPLLAFVAKLMVAPGAIQQADADVVFAAGWSEKALHDAIAVTARAAFMQRLVQGHGFIPMGREESKKRAQERIRHGYVNLFPEFRKPRE